MEISITIGEIRLAQAAFPSLFDAVFASTRESPWKRNTEFLQMALEAKSLGWKIDARQMPVEPAGWEDYLNEKAKIQI